MQDTERLSYNDGETKRRLSCFSRSVHLSRLTIYCSAAVLLVLGLLIGFLAGFYVRPSSKVNERLWTTLTGFDLDPTISKRLMNEIKPENIRKHHRLHSNFFLYTYLGAMKYF